eukprot:7086210-Prymnesium_polylepis.1
MPAIHRDPARVKKSNAADARGVGGFTLVAPHGADADASSAAADADASSAAADADASSRRRWHVDYGHVAAGAAAGQGAAWRH